MDAQIHELAVQGRLDHVTDLTLGLGDQNFKGQSGNLSAAFLLQQQIADLRAVTVGDNYSIFRGKLGDLPDRHGQISKLLLDGTLFSLADERIAAQGDQQRWLLGLLHLSISCLSNTGFQGSTLSVQRFKKDPSAGKPESSKALSLAAFQPPSIPASSRWSMRYLPDSLAAMSSSKVGLPWSRYS